MLVSVCIPTYNGEKYIVEAVRSVLDQRYRELEIIVADHGSSDSTLKAVTSLNDERIRIIHTLRSATVAENWNNSVAASSGSLVKVMGQDDILYPDALEKEVSAILQHGPDAAFCFSDRDIVDRSSRVSLRPSRRRGQAGIVVADQLLRLIVRSGTNPIGEPVAVLFRRESFDRVGGFRGDYVIDLDFYVRMLNVGNAVWSGARIGAFRVHAASWGSRLLAGQFKIIALFSEMRSNRPEVVRRSDLISGSARAIMPTPLRVMAQQVIGRR